MAYLSVHSMHSISGQRDVDKFLGIIVSWFQGFMVPCPPSLDSKMSIGFMVYLSMTSISGQRDVDRFHSFMIYLSKVSTGLLVSWFHGLSLHALHLWTVRCWQVWVFWFTVWLILQTSSFMPIDGKKTGCLCKNTDIRQALVNLLWFCHLFLWCCACSEH